MTLILVLRWAAFGWMAFVAAFGGQIVRTDIGAAVLAVVFVWTLIVTLTPQRKGSAAIDLGLAAVTIVVGGFVEPAGRVLTAHPSFAGIYPTAAVAAWAVIHGVRGGFAAGAMLAAVVPLQYYFNGVTPVGLLHLETLALLGTMLSYPLIGAVVGIVTGQLLRLTALADHGARLEERARLAAEIHDDVLQRLAAIRRDLPDAAARAALERQERKLRRIHLDEDTPHEDCSLAEEIYRLVEEFSDVPVRVASTGRAPMARQTVTIVVAAVKETLTNVRNHAQANRVWIAILEDPEGVLVTVRDNGIGFDFDEAALTERGRLGLSLSVKARVENVGGTVKVKSRKGRGTEVEMWIPRSG
ncbi:hypothetical protein LFM09_09280 [Lentzea alba]|uniref:sensor histidine kinase n=1 Tax=Lentzea alba TaxID=2714351 RepID=UPI0039BF0CFA